MADAEPKHVDVRGLNTWVLVVGLLALVVGGGLAVGSAWVSGVSAYRLVSDEEALQACLLAEAEAKGRLGGFEDVFSVANRRNVEAAVDQYEKTTKTPSWTGFRSWVRGGDDLPPPVRTAVGGPP